MRSAFVLLLFPALLCTAPLRAQEQPTAPEAPAAVDSHAELSDALVTLLRHTVATLEECRDAATVTAALPTLRTLRTEAAQLTARQAQLPEPTVQDYMAAQARANDFLDAKRAIQTHIARLQTEGLMSDEIREILGIAPETPSSAE